MSYVCLFTYIQVKFCFVGFELPTHASFNLPGLNPLYLKPTGACNDKYPLVPTEKQSGHSELPQLLSSNDRMLYGFHSKRFGACFTAMPVTYEPQF